MCSTKPELKVENRVCQKDAERPIRQDLRGSLVVLRCDSIGGAGCEHICRRSCIVRALELRGNLNMVNDRGDAYCYLTLTKARDYCRAEK